MNADRRTLKAIERARAEGRLLNESRPAEPPAPPPDCPEDVFLRAVILLAQARGWLVFHARPARTGRGWRTAVSGDGAGFPDLILVRGGELIVAELKVGASTADADQVRWLDAFRETGCASGVWRPADWNTIRRVLT